MPAAPKLLVRDVLQAVHRIAPPGLAESWDNVGLQAGDPAAPAGKVYVALEVTSGVLAEAAKVGAGTLVTHHPLLFRAAKSLAEDTTTNRLLGRVLRQGHALIAAHTNLDSVGHGTNGELADRLGLQTAGRRFLRPVAMPGAGVVKYVVFVPATHADAVLEAIAGAGGGVIGAYSHCSFQAAGTGTYRPLEGANPYAGKVGRLEKAEELRLEAVVPRPVLGRVLTAVRAVHPYEEVAYDVYPLENATAPSAGLGLVGTLPKATTLAGLARAAKKALGVKTVALVGDAAGAVESVALCTGAGGEFVRTWRPGTADCFVTGEMNHHDCIEALEQGVPVLLVGHWASEVIVRERFADMIRQHLAEAGFPAAEVVASSVEKDPVQYL